MKSIINHQTGRKTREVSQAERLIPEEKDWWLGRGKHPPVQRTTGNMVLLS
jgi:hypothetical protein